jgi:hypothetical protein
MTLEAILDEVDQLHNGNPHLEEVIHLVGDGRQFPSLSYSDLLSHRLEVPYGASLSASDATILGTSSVQLGEIKNGALLPKRHQTKHLKFVVS